MRIALVVHDFDPSFGHGRYAVELARRVADHHELDIYANSFAVTPIPNVVFHQVRAWRRTAVTTIVTFLITCEALLRSRRYDVIHAQGVTCWGADIITAHICNAARLRRLSSRDMRARLFSRLMAPLESRFYRQSRACHLIAVSRALARELAQHYGWRRDLSVIYHGTDTVHFRPPLDRADKQRARLQYGVAESDWLWLFVGEATKGLERVFSRLARFPHARLLVVSRSNVVAMQAQAEERGVAEQVIFHGPVGDPADAYRAADVLVYPSEYDAFGLVVAEAMSSALPVIVSSAAGAAEWIVHQTNGLVCDPHDSASLHELLDWLDADRTRAASLGAAARQTVERNSWDACAAATLRIYEAVGGART